MILAAPPATAKRYRKESHRGRPPGEMLERVRPLLPLAGISRLAVLTGLDRVGIPTVSAVRPAGSTLSIHAGKGLDLDAALASAAMEAIEVFHAETAPQPFVTATYEDLASRFATAPVDRLALRRHAIFDTSFPERWTLGWDVLHNCEVAVPFDQVVLGRRSGRVFPRTFQSTSNGLASGTTPVEALVVALLEVIERDALASHRLAAHLGVRPLARVSLRAASHFPMVADLLQRFERAKIQPIVFDCTVDTGVPVFWAILYDLTTRGLGLFHGGGAHLDPEVAIVRALLEAAQSRAVYISGARDDVSQRSLVRLRSLDTAATIDTLNSYPVVVDLGRARSQAQDTFEADLALLLHHLQAIGIEQVVTVDLTLPEFSDTLAVVRVIVPGLDGPGYQRGHQSPRAQAFVERAKAGAER